MSVSGEKKREISTAPRMVLLRTCSTPGTLASCASSGRVKPARMVSTGAPESEATTCSRGNVTSG